MGIFSKKHSFAKWINHPVHFLFWVAAGFSFWTMNFEEKKVDLNSVQLSSLSENLIKEQNTDYKTLQRLSVQKEIQAQVKTVERAPSSVVVGKHKKGLPKKFQKNPAFMLFGKIEEFIE